MKVKKMKRFLEIIGEIEMKIIILKKLLWNKLYTKMKILLF